MIQTVFIEAENIQLVIDEKKEEVIVIDKDTNQRMILSFAAIVDISYYIIPAIRRTRMVDLTDEEVSV